MYCYKCGKELSDSAKFCQYCGAEQEYAQQQKQIKEPVSHGKKGFWGIIRKVLLVLVLVPLAILGLLVVLAFFEDDEEQIHPETTAATELSTLEDGWHALYGERYYIEDGLKYAGLHEIDDKLYFFDDEGILAVNQDVRYESVVLQAGHDGQITAITYDAVYGKWAEEDYHFGNGGSSSILELSSEIENCDSFSFYLESHGERGAKVNGTWKVYIRCNGKWEFVDKINYTEPNGSFYFTFDTPKTFDAITAYPTVQGNASYSSLFYLKDVHCFL